MSNNPFEAPSVELNELISRETAEVYSPNQIAAGSFFGGPIAAIYFLRSNYFAIGQFEHAKRAVVLGTVFMVFLLGIILFLPENFPNTVIPVIYSLAAKQIANTTQLSKDEISKDAKYSFASNWKVFGVAVISAIVFTVIAVAVVLSASELGLVEVG